MVVDQKKILILGGTKHMIDAVEGVIRMGMSPIVVDDIIGAPAKEYADKSFNISAADVEKLAGIVENERVDGVSASFENINIWYAIALCKKADLPFYTSKKQWSLIRDMEKFKEICRRFDVSVIERCELPIHSAISIWKFPVIIESEKNSEEWTGVLPL